MKVTKSDGAKLFTLDNRPAVHIHEDYFGAKASDLRQEPLARMAITYPLGIKVPDLDEYLIRDPITVDENGAITSKTPFFVSFVDTKNSVNICITGA
jgi:hypothetical protein